jgi:hypothetical protein
MEFSSGDWYSQTLRCRKAASELSDLSDPNPFRPCKIKHRKFGVPSMRHRDDYKVALANLSRSCYVGYLAIPISVREMDSYRGQAARSPYLEQEVCLRRYRHAGLYDVMLVHPCMEKA